MCVNLLLIRMRSYNNKSSAYKDTRFTNQVHHPLPLHSNDSKFSKYYSLYCLVATTKQTVRRKQGDRFYIDID